MNKVRKKIQGRGPLTVYVKMSGNYWESSSFPYLLEILTKKFIMKTGWGADLETWKHGFSRKKEEP